MAFDLGVISQVQVTALAYALFTIYKTHPLHIEYAGGYFTMVSTNEVNPNDASYPAFRKSKLSGPTLVYVKKLKMTMKLPT